jgi:hypothetical protein
LLWENHFTGYYLQKNYCAWLYGENSERFWTDGNFSKCLKKDICNVREIREDAVKLSVSHELGRLIFVGYMAGISKSLGGINRKLVFCINGIG